MKTIKYLIFTIIVSLLLSCEETPPAPQLERSLDPLRCTSTGSQDCGVDWFLQLKAFTFPSNIQVEINSKVVIDECDPQSYWSKNSSTRFVEFVLKDFPDLKGNEVIEFRLFDMKNCSELKKEILFSANQSYFIKNVGGRKAIFIEREL
jgi:hypothetical protein